MSELEVRPLDATTWDALARLFERPGDPRWCWCMFWRKPGSSWANADAAANRAGLRTLADAPRSPGLVAVRGDEAVGWVSVAPRPDYPRLARSRTIPQLPGEDVWAVVCFVVARTARRTGVAATLLDAAADLARTGGARVLEGYPVRTDGARMPSAAAYTGTLGMFERAGFVVVAETSSRPAPGLLRVVVRRQLDPA
jgi:GNAT superfamily N-acetyltransferase